MEVRKVTMPKSAEQIDQMVAPEIQPISIQRDRESPEPKDLTLRILLVDDNVDAAGSLRALLNLVGYQVRTEPDGDLAIDVVPEFKPDVILLDIGLPTIDGYEACHQIRLLPEGNGIFICAITGWDKDEDRKKSKDAGFDQHLVKPVNIEKLLDTLSKIKSRLDGLVHEG